MKGRIGRTSCLLASVGLAATLLFAAPAQASGAWVCSGTLSSPGVLAGQHWSDVVVRGFCAVNGGRAVVHGDVIVGKGSALVAAFGQNDVSGRGRSSLKVTGAVRVGTDAGAILGCEPEAFACIDDPHQNHPTLASSTTILGNLKAAGALGVIVHNSRIDGFAKLTGGGGGVTCTPPAGSVFAAFGSPAYSDLEDNWIGRGLTITDLSSCWLGSLRNDVGRNVRVMRNTMADPDAMEINTNTVHGSMSCYRNSPAVQFGDSGGDPNVVYGSAAGQCSFKARRPNPAPHGPLQHISVRPHP